jgi:tetratricopeptide (TPR) repeat protein
MVAVTMEQAREALRLAEADPQRAVALASDVLRRALDARDLAIATVAERALGLATLHLHDLDTALRHLRTAIRYGREASPALAAEARMTLAFALNRRGRSASALREIDTALLDLDGVPRARAEAQRGAILHQLGRFAEALASYRAALPILRRADDHLWTLRVLNNRGLLHGHWQEFAAAEADLREADRLSHQLGLDLFGAFVQQNLGEIHALRGDVPAALHCLDRAEERFRALKSQIGSLLTDRSRLLLSVRLVSEAREAAEQAVQEFERERRRIALPEVRLLLARAALLDGDAASALRQARTAVREFSRQRRPEWAELARFAMLTARQAEAERVGVGSPLRVREFERAADGLAAAGWPAEALEARVLAARLAFDRGWIGRGRAALERASLERRRRGPATLRARAWYAEACLRLAFGNRRGATTAAQAGLRVLDEHHATLGATDLRAYASGHRTDLADLGLRIAVEDGNPYRVLAWAEHGRASHLLLAPARPPDDPKLVAALGDLRATMAEMDQHRTHGGGSVRAGRGTARLLQRQVTLERIIRDYCRQQAVQGRGTRIRETTRTAAPVAVDDLAEALGDAALLEFVQFGDALHVVSVIDGQVRLRRLGPLAELRDLVESVPFALRRLARAQASAASHAAANAVVRYAAAGLDTAVLDPVRDEVGDRPLVLIPTGVLQSLPWSILPSCAGRPVTVSPSAALWLAASRRPAEPARPVLVAGYGLPGALAEAEAVAALYGQRPLLGDGATVDAVTSRMVGAGVMHLAAHGRLRAHNPLFSSLLLADGPLTVYDLERLVHVPKLVVLAACDSGRTVVVAGDELLGITATLLASGAQQVVASVVPVPDAETAPLMVAFHQLMVRGRSAAEALALAQQQMAGRNVAEIAAAAGFVCMGADLTLPSVPARSGVDALVDASR